MLGGKGHQFLIVKVHIPLVAAEECYGCILFIIDSPNIVFPGINRERTIVQLVSSKIVSTFSTCSGFTSLNSVRQYGMTKVSVAGSTR
jgi:hypothetical protein